MADDFYSRWFSRTQPPAPTPQQLWERETARLRNFATSETAQQLVERFREDYTIFFTADHGGHGRNHGSAEDCDMKIPLICIGPDFTPGPMDSAPNIMDLAPTITRLMGARAASEWEGQSLV